MDDERRRRGGAGPSTSPRPVGGPSSSKAVSCGECRRQKVRCVTEVGDHKCLRCLRMRRMCIRPTPISRPWSSSTSPPPTQEHDEGKGREAEAATNGSRAKRTRRSGVELGLPAVSNPLRLLAEAGHGHGGDTSWLSYFSDGVFDSRPEVGRHLDPIAGGLVTEEQARELHTFFMVNLNPRTTLLDPEIYTFEHIGRHNALSTAIFFAAARFETKTHSLSKPLEDHLRQHVIPHVVLYDCATIELVIAFLIYGAYYPVTPRVIDDRSWSVVCHAARMATELDLNSRIHSSSLDETAGMAEARLARHYRTRERTWLNLWLQEQSFANKTGRLPFLATRGVVDQSRDWHRSVHAIEGDGVVVAHVQLRLLSMRCQELFERLRTSDENIEYYLERADADVEAWSALHKDIEPTAKRSAKMAIYKQHIRVMILVMPLQHPQASSSSTAPLANSTLPRLQDAVLAYLAEVVSPAMQQEARYSHNSLFTAASYVAVLALRLVALAGRHAFVRADALTRAVVDTARVFREASRDNGGTGGVAHRHAEYLEWLISRQQQAQQQQQQQQQRQQQRQPIENNRASAPSEPTVLPYEPKMDGTLDLQQTDLDALFADVDFASWVQRFIEADS